MTSENDKKEKIRPIYAFLQGCLSQAPDMNKYPLIQTPNVWKLVNLKIDNLKTASGENFSEFKLIPNRSSYSTESLETDIYRTTLGGLISELHGKYFSDEPAPFSGMPSTINIQTQQQSQAVYVQMLLEFQSKVDEQLSSLEPGDKKHTFLKKVKGALASVKDYAGLISLIITTAQKVGLTIEELSVLFK